MVYTGHFGTYTDTYQQFGINYVGFSDLTKIIARFK